MGMNVPSSSGGRSSRRAPMAEINVTPFVDVMLVLLIIFMVTAPLLVAGVPVNLPESSAKPLEQQKEPIEIAVDRDGVIYVDGTETRRSQLPRALADIAANDADQTEKTQILLRGDRDINYGQVIFVMGELNNAGLNQISLVTEAAANTTQSAASSSASVSGGSSSSE